MLSSDNTEFNNLSQQFYNPLPTYQLLFSQINEMNDALDRLPLQGGPIEQCTFTTLQEKMIILIQLRLTFPNQITRTDSHCNHDKASRHCYTKKDNCIDPKVIFSRISALLSKLTQKIKGPHVALNFLIQSIPDL